MCEQNCEIFLLFSYNVEITYYKQNTSYFSTSLERVKTFVNQGVII